MYFKSKTVLLVALAVLALFCSRAIFWLINDPEGPNLLVVTVLAVIIYIVFFTIYVLARRVQ